MKKVCLDTNILLDSPHILDELDNVILCTSVLEEIDGLKKSQDVGYKARLANRKIRDNIHKIKFIIKDVYDNIPEGWDKEKRDNKIVLTALENDAILYSNDINVKIKAESLGIECVDMNGKQSDGDYKGWKEIKGDTEYINSYYQDIYDGKIKFLTNEYLIEYNTDTDERAESRFDGERFVSLSLPPSKVIKGLNAYQRCSIDLLYNKNIPIKVITGLHGSGKTLLASKIGLHEVVDKEHYKTLLFLRNPITADGTDIGFLKGTKEEKINEYMQPLLQYVENDKNQGYAEMLIKNEKIKLDVISFLKGVNIDDMFVICDEAEDLNTKLIKLIGSRIAKKSCIVFTGDYKQAENKYKSDNGLVKLISEAKGDSLVGIVNLPEDLRSEASKIFAEL